jgi:ribosome-associated protein
MDTIDFRLKDDFIPLIQLLKFTGHAESGAHASDMVVNGEVFCNGVVETRKRYKVKQGDVITSDYFTINIIK